MLFQKGGAVQPPLPKPVVPPPPPPVTFPKPPPPMDVPGPAVPPPPPAVIAHKSMPKQPPANVMRDPAWRQQPPPAAVMRGPGFTDIRLLQDPNVETVRHGGPPPSDGRATEVAQATAEIAQATAAIAQARAVPKPPASPPPVLAIDDLQVPPQPPSGLPPFIVKARTIQLTTVPDSVNPTLVERASDWSPARLRPPPPPAPVTEPVAPVPAVQAEDPEPVEPADSEPDEEPDEATAAKDPWKKYKSNIRGSMRPPVRTQSLPPPRRVLFEPVVVTVEDIAAQQPACIRELVPLATTDPSALQADILCELRSNLRDKADPPPTVIITPTPLILGFGGFPGTPVPRAFPPKLSLPFTT